MFIQHCTKTVFKIPGLGIYYKGFKRQDERVPPLISTYIVYLASEDTRRRVILGVGAVGGYYTEVMGRYWAQGEYFRPFHLSHINRKWHIPTLAFVFLRFLLLRPIKSQFTSQIWPFGAFHFQVAFQN